ncbi:MAG: hypothetical protein ACRDO1_07255 [Nocardioidaceae bacterium]
MILAVAGTLLAAGVAWATHIDNIVPTATYNHACDEGSVDGGGTLCRTDNGAVYYYMDSNGDFELEAGDRSVVRNMLSAQYSPTDLAIHYDSTPVFSGSGETDIIYQEGAVPGSADGINWCNDDSPSPTYECDQQYIRIQGAGDYTPGLSCHETGHAVGLTHGAQASPVVSQTNDALGCMQTPVSFSEPLGANQSSNINAVYARP